MVGEQAHEFYCGKIYLLNILDFEAVLNTKYFFFKWLPTVFSLSGIAASFYFCSNRRFTPLFAQKFLKTTRFVNKNLPMLSAVNLVTFFNKK